MPTEATAETVKLIRNEAGNGITLNQILRANMEDPNALEYLSGQQLATKHCVKIIMVSIIEKSLGGPITSQENDLLNAMRVLVCRTGLLDEQVAQ